MKFEVVIGYQILRTSESTSQNYFAKSWRRSLRLWISCERTVFFSYLKFPSHVNGLRWKRPPLVPVPLFSTLFLSLRERVTSAAWLNKTLWMTSEFLYFSCLGQPTKNIDWPQSAMKLLYWTVITRQQNLCCDEGKAQVWQWWV